MSDKAREVAGPPRELGLWPKESEQAGRWWHQVCGLGLIQYVALAGMD